MYGNKKTVNVTGFSVAFLLLIVISVMMPQIPFAHAETSKNYAGSVLANTWTGEAAANGPDNSFCATSKGGELGYWQNFGIKIPDKSKITGIEVFVDSSQLDSETHLILNVGKTSKTLSPTEIQLTPTTGNCVASTDQKLGGPAELWGLSWTPEEINSKTFGVQVKSDLGNSVLYLDSIGIVVYYESDNATEKPITISTGPTNLVATALSQSIINLSWSASENKITGYIIERKSIDQDDYTVIDNLLPRFLTYSDAGLLGNTEYQYKVSAINSDGTLSSSNVVSATTMSFMNYKKSIEAAAPSTNNIDFKIQNGTQTSAFSQRLTGYTVIPTQTMQTGVEQQLQISVSDNSGIATIKHVGVLMYFDDDILKKGDTYFVYDEGAGLTVSDPLGFFDGVQVHRTFTKTEMIIQFIFTPQKPMPVTDLVINGWDDQLNSKSAFIPDAIEIQGQSVSTISALTAQVPDKTPKLSYVIDSDGNTLSYDSFGKLYTKQIRVMDEVVQYGDYVGRSERHDNGFYDRVEVEKAKAQALLDSMNLHKIFDEPKKIFKVDKVFKYPKNVGKTDRRDVQSIKTMMEKENTKAQGHK